MKGKKSARYVILDLQIFKKIIFRSYERQKPHCDINLLHFIYFSRPKMPTCEVLSCKTGYKDEPKGIQTFHFPKDRHFLKKWLEMIGRKNYEPNADARICVRHFDKSALRYTARDHPFRPKKSKSRQMTKPKLMAGAYPTLHLKPQKGSINRAHLTLQTSQEIKHPKAIINDNKDQLNVDSRIEIKHETQESMSKSDLNKHVESDHEESKPFKCKICDYKSATKGNLKRHIESVHEGIKPFKCTICDFKASEKRNLSKHIESVHERIKPTLHLKTLKGSINRAQLTLQTSQEIMHPKATINENKKKMTEFSQGTYVCPTCNGSFIKKCHLERHINSVHERKKYSCSFCGKSFSRNAYLKNHITSKHPSKSVHSISLSDITVANMSKSAKEIYEASLALSHTAVVSKENNPKPNGKSKTLIHPFCQNCNQTFDNKHELNVHSCLEIKQETQHINTIYVKEENIDSVDYLH